MGCGYAGRGIAQEYPPRPKAEPRSGRGVWGGGLRVDRDCVVSRVDCQWLGGRPASACPFSVRSESVYVCGAAARRKSVYVRYLPVRDPVLTRCFAHCKTVCLDRYEFCMPVKVV